MQSWALKLNYLLDGYQFQIDFRYELTIFLETDDFMELLNFIQIFWEIVRFQKGNNKGKQLDNHLLQVRIDLPKHLYDMRERPYYLEPQYLGGIIDSL